MLNLTFIYKLSTFLLLSKSLKNLQLCFLNFKHSENMNKENYVSLFLFCKSISDSFI